VERAKLERRFEKLVNLHFPPPTENKAEDSKEKEKSSPSKNENGSLRGLKESRRSSSFFDLDINDLRSMSVSDWRGVLGNSVRRTSGSTKDEIRSTSTFYYIFTSS
jgi:hypothetical protein